MPNNIEASTASKKTGYRYPGTKPFSEAESKLFNGRADDIKNLANLVSIQNLVVLYGRSGLGKSSLLNAGLINKFGETPNISSLFTRFGAYFQEAHTDPLQKLITNIKEAAGNSGPTFLSQKFKLEGPSWDNSLWYLIKNIQIGSPSKNTFVLIFDQFEEIFTYPEDKITEFKKQLSELLYINMPQEVHDIFSENTIADENFLTNEETDLLFSPVNIKILFSIRSDKMSLLNKFTDYFPSVLQKCYELKPLTGAQARTAITGPAALVDPAFVAPPFVYTDEVLDVIISSLLPTSKGTAGFKDEIETFQLQIVCKYAEDFVIEHNDTTVSVDDLGNIKEIFENHYKNIIKKLPESEQLPARQLIEEKLIIDGMRVSMPIPFILRDKGMTKALLDKLIETHILRPEQNNTVEISHDTLIEPILKFYEERKYKEGVDLELKQKENEINRIKDEKDRELRRIRRKQKNRRKIMVISGIAASVLLILAYFVGNSVKLQARARGMKYIKKMRDTAAFSDPTFALRYLDSAKKAIWRVDKFALASVEKAEEQIKANNFFYKDLSTTKPGNFVSISDNGSLAISDMGSGILSLFELNKRKVTKIAYKGKLRSAGFLLNYDKILLGGANGNLDIYDVATNTTTRIGNYKSAIKTVAVPGYIPYILILTEKGTVEILNMEGVTQYKLPDSTYTCALFSPSGDAFLTGSSNGTISLWKLEKKGRPERSFRKWNVPITSLAFTSDGTMFATGTESGFVNIWDITDTTKSRITFGKTGLVTSICLVDEDVDGKAEHYNVYVGDNKKNITLWRIDHEFIRSSTSRDTLPVFWYRKDMDLRGHKGKILSIKEYDEMVVSCSEDGTAKLWSKKWDIIDNL